MANIPHYQKAYELAKRELADLLVQKDRVENRIVIVRKSLDTLASLCEDEGVDIEPSLEAAYLLENSTISDEVRAVLSSASDAWFRPTELKGHLERLGHDLTKYQNPQATIHMVLKRMAESGEIEEKRAQDGKAVYRRKPTTEKVEEWVEKVHPGALKMAHQLMGRNKK